MYHTYIRLYIYFIRYISFSHFVFAFYSKLCFFPPSFWLWHPMQGCLPVFWITAKKIKYVRQKCDFSSCFYHMNVFVCFSVKHARAKLIIPWKLDNTSFKFPIFGVRISLLPIFIPMVVNVSFFFNLSEFYKQSTLGQFSAVKCYAPTPPEKRKNKFLHKQWQWTTVTIQTKDKNDLQRKSLLDRGSVKRGNILKLLRRVEIALGEWQSGSSVFASCWWFRNLTYVGDVWKSVVGWTIAWLVQVLIEADWSTVYTWIWYDLVVAKSSWKNISRSSCSKVWGIIIEQALSLLKLVKDIPWMWMLKQNQEYIKSEESTGTPPMPPPKEIRRY